MMIASSSRIISEIPIETKHSVLMEKRICSWTQPADVSNEKKGRGKEGNEVRKKRGKAKLEAQHKREQSK